MNNLTIVSIGAVAAAGILLWLIGLFAYSRWACEQKTLINCKYQGGIVIEIGYPKPGMCKRYTIKHNGHINYAYPYDIDKYIVGDTINKPCQ